MPEVYSEQVAKPSSSFKQILLVVGVLVLVGTSAYTGYWYGIQQVPPPATTPEVTPPVTGVPESTPPAEVDETVGWKTYESIAAKYTLKYPSDWTVKELEKGYPTSVENNIGWAVVYSGDSGVQVSIQVSNTDTAKSLAEGKQRYDGEKFSLGGKEAYRWFDQKGSLCYVLAINGDYVYSINMEGLKEESFGAKKEQYLATFNQILSTFKFID